MPPRRTFTKAVVLAPVIGALSETALSIDPLLAYAQTPRALGLQQTQSATGSWSLTGPLPDTRSVHTATLLPNGQVLVAAGVSPIQPAPDGLSSRLTSRCFEKGFVHVS